MNKFIEFNKKIASDATFAEEIKKVLAANRVVKLADLSDEAVNTLILIAKKAGFEFTFAEFKAFISGDALSDEELGAVAGGLAEGRVLPSDEAVIEARKQFYTFTKTDEWPFFK